MPSSLWPPTTYTLGEKALMAAGTSRTTWWPARPGQAAGEAALSFQADISVPALPLLSKIPPHTAVCSFIAFLFGVIVRSLQQQACSRGVCHRKACSLCNISLCYVSKETAACGGKGVQFVWCQSELDSPP